MWRQDVPETLTGAAFLERWGGVDDPLSTISPGGSYPVRAAVSFPVEENFRCAVVRSLLQVRGLRVRDGRKGGPL